MNAAPMVTTLGTLSVLQGTGYILAGAGGESGGAIPTLRQLFHSVSLGFVPTPMLIFLLTLLAAVVLLKKTALGASIYAMGGSAEACLMAGVPVRRICRVVFFLAGVCAAISGVLFASQMNTGSVVLGENLNLMVLSSCVVGGVSVVGGQGDPLRMISGVAAIQVIQNIMSLYAVAASTQLLITGLILVLILVFDRKLQGRKGAAK